MNDYQPFNGKQRVGAKKEIVVGQTTRIPMGLYLSLVTGNTG